MNAMIDLDNAYGFMASNARLLDRRRFEVVVQGAPREGVLAALEAYRNADGGYSWGLEPDLRATESQPGPALHAFEVFEDIAPATSPRAIELCDWLDKATLDDGGLPFALPVGNSAGCAPFWAEADPTVSSLQITAIVTAMAHRVAASDPAVAKHDWLRRATDYCLEASEAVADELPAMARAFALQALGAAAHTRPEAGAVIELLGAPIPESGQLHVSGGLPDEFMRPLDFAPFPDGAVRKLLSAESVAADVERLATAQQDDGGWPLEFQAYSPAAALEWRGHLTVNALYLLRRNGVI
jgi:hypothetical protein